MEPEHTTDAVPDFPDWFKTFVLQCQQAASGGLGLEEAWSKASPLLQPGVSANDAGTQRAIAQAQRVVSHVEPPSADPVALMRQYLSVVLREPS